MRSAMRPLVSCLPHSGRRGGETVTHIVYHAPRSFVHQEASELETRFNDLQSQIDRLTTAESRGQQDVLSQFEQLQRVIEGEWRSLRLIHEAPVKQLREQAATLTEVCVATASSAVGGYERTEARLAGLEASLHERLAELSEQMRSAVVELRMLSGGQSSELVPTAPAWPLDDVVRLHNQLRESGGVDATVVAEPAPLQLPGAAGAMAERIETIERDLTYGREELQRAVARTSHAGWVSWLAIVLIVGGLGAATIVISRIQRDAVAAAARGAEAEQQAKVQVAAAREEAARAVADARATAIQAQTIANVLAAPDLTRFNLVGRDEATQFTAQVLWSRSRGFVFSGSRLPLPPPNSTYQIWLLSGADAVSAGVFTPDAEGRFSVATDTPPFVPPPIGGVIVTIEASGGAERPTGPRLLGRAEPGRVE